MKWLYTFLLFLISVGSIGQTEVTGKVTDTNGKALIYANVVTLKRKSGTSTDSTGTFTLRGLDHNDSIKVSFIGYFPVTLSISDVQMNNNIILRTRNTELNEIIIKNWNAYSVLKRVGFDKLKKNASVGLIEGDQLAVFIQNSKNKDGWIRRVFFPLTRLSPCANLFRITLYSGNQESGPKNAIFYTENPIPVNEISKRNWIEVSDSKVQFPSQGCYIAFEVLTESQGCDVRLQTSVSATMENKEIVSWINYRDQKWIKTSKSPNQSRILTPKFSLEVAFSK